MTWESIYREKGAVQTEPKHFFAESIRKYADSSARALDMGCGTGRHLPLLIESFKEVHGCDASPSALELVKPEVMAGARLKICYFSSMPYPPGYFDFVISSAALHHGKADEVRKGISELRRVLRKGGIAAVDLIAKDDMRFCSVTGEEVEKDTLVFRKGVEKGVPHHFFTKDKAREFFSGFEILHLEQVVITPEKLFGVKESTRLNVLARKK